jgi:phosphoribosylformimino-5-aminoimidazole carboxamide ribotide isomerase
MKLIPVIDVMAGQVVHARRGDRDSYRPVQSTLCPSSAPEAILQAFIENFSCATVYIADLDAIRYGRPQLELLHHLKTAFPNTQFWIDAGIADFNSFANLRELDIGIAVIGSEGLSQTDWLGALAKEDWILSLDFRGESFLGPPNLLADTAIWPQKVFGMNLAQVGSEEGPDYELLGRLQCRGNECEIYAAGGVRDETDLWNLDQRGISGALVATALHNGDIASKLRKY